MKKTFQTAAVVRLDYMICGVSVGIETRSVPIENINVLFEIGNLLPQGGIVDCFGSTAYWYNRQNYDPENLQ